MERFFALILLTICLFCSPAYGAMQDISSATGGWTHTDAGNKIDETPYRVRWNALANNESAYHYKGGYSISGDFTHYFASSFDTVPVLLGTESYNSSMIKNVAWLTQYTATGTGLANGMYVHCLGAGNVKISLYSSDGSRLAKQDTTQAVIEGWNYIAFESTASITDSTVYYIGVIADTNSISSTMFAGSGVVSKYKVSTYSSHAWPADLTGYPSDTGTEIVGYLSMETAKQTLWMVGDHVGDTYGSYVNSTSYHGLIVYIEDNGSTATLKMYERDGATGRTVATQVIPESYRYHTLFYKVVRSGSNFITYIYKEPSLTTLLYTMTASPTLNSVQTYTTIFMGNSYNTGNTSTISGYVGNLYLDETPVSIFKPVTISKPIYPDDAETDNENFPAGDETWTLGGTVSDAVTSQPAASEDDIWVYWNGSAWASSLTNALLFGYHNATVLKTGYGIRFPSVQIPKNATIASAKITLTARVDYSGTTVNGVITGEKSTNASQWSTLADYQARRGTIVGGANDNNITTAHVHWTNVEAWTKDSTYDTPSITTILQEQVNQTAWAKGNALGIFIDDHAAEGTQSGLTERQSYSYDTGTPEQLSVTYRGVNIVPSNEWSHSGTYSIKITGVDGVSDSSAYFTRSVTTFKSGILDCWFRLTELGENQGSQIIALDDSTGPSAAIVYVEDVSGVKYFRLGLYYSSAWHLSTATAITCELDTDYHLTLIYYDRFKRASLFVNNVLADYQDFTSSINPNRIYIGYWGAGLKYGGTRYIDSIKYQNGNSIFPAIARGGANKQTLVMEELLSDSHSFPQNGQFNRFWKSTDNGVTWTHLFDLTASYDHCANDKMIWNPATSTFWWFGNKRISYDSGTLWLSYPVVYEITDLETTPALTLRKNFGRQAVTGASKYTADNTTFTTDTTAANNATTGDMAIFDGTVEDAYYIGLSERFDTVEIDISQAAIGTFTVVKEYWDGDSWAALTTVNDDIDDFTVSGDKKLFRFELPSDWATTNLSGSLPSTSYWIRFRVSAFTSMGTLPLASQAVITMSGWIFPTREITDGKLLSGITYFPATSGIASSYTTSANYNLSTNVIENEFLIAKNTDLAGYTSVAEPMLWHDNSGVLHSMLRFDNSTKSYYTEWQYHLVEKYKISADNGASDWSGELLVPGVDWENHGGIMRAFVFNGYTYWQGRDSRGVGNTAILRDNDPVWIRKTSVDLSASGKIDVMAEAWWPGLSELSNGDVDGYIGGTTAAYIDLATNIAGTGFYYRLQLTDWTPSNDINFGSDF